MLEYVARKVSLGEDEEGLKNFNPNPNMKSKWWENLLSFSKQPPIHLQHTKLHTVLTFTMPTLEEIQDDEVDLEFEDDDFDDYTPFAANQPVGAADSRGPARLVPAAAAKPKPPAPSTAQIPLDHLPSLPQGLTPQNFGDSAPLGAPPAGLIDPENIDQYKTWEIVYPVYFNKDRSHSEGRRVPVDYAVEDPVAQTLLEGLKYLGVPGILEPERRHPKDWANPGRVRYILKDDDLLAERKRLGAPEINSTRHLYKLLGEYLKAHPTTQETSKRSPLYYSLKQALLQENARQPPENRKPLSELESSISFTPKAFPKGWEKKKIGSILLPNSPALTYHIVDPEDVISEMTKGMLPPGMQMPGMGPNTKQQKPKKVFIRR